MAKKGGLQGKVSAPDVRPGNKPTEHSAGSNKIISPFKDAHQILGK